MMVSVLHLAFWTFHHDGKCVALGILDTHHDGKCVALGILDIPSGW